MPVGPGTYGRFLEIRIFDFWVHDDITTPLAKATDDAGVPPRLRWVRWRGRCAIVGKKVGLPDGKSMAFRLTGRLLATSTS